MAREIAEDITRRADTDREIAETIGHFGGLDIAACEAAALAHDIGHPPFGHSGEVALNRSLRDAGVTDGFEGNAQSLRIVARLDLRKLDSQEHGLDLSAVTLAGILKYPFGCPADSLTTGANAQAALRKPPKFGYFTDDEATFMAVSERVPTPEVDGFRRQTLEASVMDLADDITYAAHDLEDAFRENAIDFALVGRDINAAITFLAGSDVAELGDEPSNPFLKVAVDLSTNEYFNKDLYKSELQKTAIALDNAGFRFRYDGAQNKLTTAAAELAVQIERMFKNILVTVEPPWPGGPSVYLDREEWHLMQCLKSVTRHYVVGTARVGIIEAAQQTVVMNLFNRLVAWLDSGPRLSELPHPMVDFLRSAGVEGQRMPALAEAHYRVVSDYICSMSDQECLMRARWLEGIEVPEFANSH